METPEWAKRVPDNPKLLSSYKKACTAALTPLVLDAETGYAEFSGNHGYYPVTLENCPCGSKPKPCKHMYRLALELGTLEGTFQSDETKVKWKRTGIPLDEAIARVESVSKDAQRVLWRYLPMLRTCRALSAARESELAALDELCEAELLVRTDDPPGWIMHPDIDKSSWKLTKYLRCLFDWIPCMDADESITRYPYTTQDEQIQAFLSRYGHT